MTVDAERLASPDGIVKGPQSLISGLVLIALALFAIYITRDLPQGTLRAMGPAMLPRWLAIGVGLCGLGLAVSAFLQVGQALEQFTFRGPVMVTLGVMAFFATIRGLQFDFASIPQLGLIVAGPLAMFIGGFATPEVRWRELMILALALTAFCMILFGDLLNLPIPMYPQWMSDLYPTGWSNDGRLRATAGIMILLSVVVYFVIPRHREPEAIDVVSDEHSGQV